MDVKERRAMQDRVDALVNDWLFQPDRREDVIRTLAQASASVHPEGLRAGALHIAAGQADIPEEMLVEFGQGAELLAPLGPAG